MSALVALGCKAYFAANVKIIMSVRHIGFLTVWLRVSAYNPEYAAFFFRKPLDKWPVMGIIIFTHPAFVRGRTMANSKRPDPKVAALRQEGSLNPHPETVTDPLFASSAFFDGRDVIQVKYEMVRRVRADGQTVSQAAAAFGFSRPSFYQAQAALDQEGLPGLLPRKRGPRSPHKLGAEVLEFLGGQLAQEPSLSSAELARRVGQQFGIQVHPRSVERALARQEKKRP